MILKKGIDDKETIEFLGAMGLFEGSTDDEKENLLRNLSTREYEPGELMMDEDDLSISSRILAQRQALFLNGIRNMAVEKAETIAGYRET